MKKPSKKELQTALKDFKEKANSNQSPLFVKRNARMAIIILTRQLRELYGEG